MKICGGFICLVYNVESQKYGSISYTKNKALSKTHIIISSFSLIINL